MKLAPRESEKLALHNAGYLAQKRLARGLKLNYTEAVALIASQILEFVRDGDKSVADLANIGKLLLRRRQVLPSVVHLLDMVEGTFPDGTKLVTIYDPIACENGRLELALHGSFLPAPSVENFRGMDDDVKPGEIILGDGPILINTGRKAVEILVVNKADRPVQVPPEVCRCCSSSSTLLRSSPAPLLLLLLSCCKYIAGGTISQWFVCLLSSRMILRGHTIHKVLIISIRCCCCWNFYSHGLAAAAGI